MLGNSFRSCDWSKPFSIRMSIEVLWPLRRSFCCRKSTSRVESVTSTLGLLEWCEIKSFRDFLRPNAAPACFWRIQLQMTCPWNFNSYRFFKLWFKSSLQLNFPAPWLGNMILDSSVIYIAVCLIFSSKSLSFSCKLSISDKSALLLNCICIRLTSALPSNFCAKSSALKNWLKLSTTSSNWWNLPSIF